MSDQEAIFANFTEALEKDLNKVYQQTLQTQLDDLRKENNILEMKVILLHQQWRTLKASVLILKEITENSDEIKNEESAAHNTNENNEKLISDSENEAHAQTAKGYEDIAKVDEDISEVDEDIAEVDEDSSEVDEDTAEVEEDVAEVDEGVSEMVEDIAKRILVETVQFLEEEVMPGELEEKDRNNNLKKKSQEPSLRLQASKPLTRGRKRTHGGTLVNPRKFYSCVACEQGKHMDYSETSLIYHYRVSHKFIATPGNLPKHRSQVEEAIDVDRQSSLKCRSCGHECENSEDLAIHKSKHPQVPKKFCQYKCKDCDAAFVLNHELINHQMVCH